MPHENDEIHVLQHSCQGLLTWEELSKVILDIEVTINKRPLCYVEKDVKLPDAKLQCSARVATLSHRRERLEETRKVPDENKRCDSA